MLCTFFHLNINYVIWVSNLISKQQKLRRYFLSTPPADSIILVTYLEILNDVLFFFIDDESLVLLK